jgi:glycosyltransferase involved in cell wall biosynthesis
MRILATCIIDLEKTTHSRTHEIVNHLARSHEVTALCLNAWWMTRPDGSLLYGDDYYKQYFTALKEKAKVVHFAKAGVRPFLQEISFARHAGDVLGAIGARQMDVHLNCGTHLSGYAVGRKMKRWGIPTVFDVYDDLPERARMSPQVPGPLRYLGWLVALWAYRKNMGLADRVTVITEALRHAYGWGQDKSQIVPNGVDTTLFAPQQGDRLRERLGLADDFVIGYVGLLREWVDLEPPLLALAHSGEALPKAKLLIVGEEGALQRVKDLAIKYGVTDRVLFAGTVPYTEVPQYVSAMDVCLIPIAQSADCQRAFPLKLLEYMACGKPVISTPVAGVREVASSRVLYASDSEAFAERFSQLHQDEGLRRELGREGRRFVEERYTWKRACTALEEVLEDVAAHRSGEIAPELR